ncbi:MAG: S46 family peptidase [Bacteroidales bacterium]|nr:S46 family peptidase [Bacteroidales bacterium]
MGKKILFFLWISVCDFFFIYADEGMWLPLYLSSLGDSTLQTYGFRISAEEIYSVNKGSLKDAVVMFGRGCTGVFVSQEGLLMTNHHCAQGTIQRLSTVENDYLKYGYWAKNRDEELPCNGLTITRLVRMEDVTAEIFHQLPSNLTEEEKSQYLETKIKSIIQRAVRNTHYQAQVKSFYYGNQYVLMVYEVFRDVRLVGAPPTFIGSFGGDEDNWVWPRHSGDFAIFRVYADNNNKPASFHKNNKPYQPLYVPPISLKGVRENDFVFVYGFPGKTQHFLTDDGISLVVKGKNPVAVRIRRKKMDVLREFMEKNDTLRILYTNIYAGIANYWKKMDGESWGVKKSNAIELRKQEINQMIQNIQDPALKTYYLKLRDTIQNYYKRYYNYAVAETYLLEGWFSLGVIQYAMKWLEIYDSLQRDISPSSLQNKILSSLDEFTKNYHLDVEKRQLMALLDEIKSFFNFSHEIPDGWRKLILSNNNEFEKIFDHSVLFSSKKIVKLFKNSPTKIKKKLKADEFFTLVHEMYQLFFTMNDSIDFYENKLYDAYSRWVRLYFLAGDKNKLYPDANSTMRVAWGRVQGYEPRDAVTYLYYTTPDGIFQKTLSGIKEYEVDTTFYRLLKSRDYGEYADQSGELRLCFRSNTHTTGGNSGSPVFNAYGELVGLNFDRAWEGTMSDLYYDSSICGNVVVDIRYCLWVIDKYANADYILKEMQLIR